MYGSAGVVRIVERGVVTIERGMMVDRVGGGGLTHSL
jgi:hypothetical protein